MKRNVLLNRTLFLLFGIILIIPVFGINANPESVSYDVNPYNYMINVIPGDSRTYVFSQIRSSSFDGSDMMIEENEVTLELKFRGLTENRTINEGTKLRVEVISINDTSIELNSTYYILDGPIYNPDTFLINRSRLDLNTGSGPRFIMTTNISLIHQVYDGISEWNTEIDSENTHFYRHEWNDSFGYSEHYEYDNDGFLRHLNLHNNYDGGYTDIELSSINEINPDFFTLGVAPGDSQFYTLRTINFYDWEQGTYFHDIPITVKQGESLFHHSLKAGDRVYIEVTNTSGDYVKFSTKYYPQDGPEINDETVHVMDKTSGYFSLNRILHGPPILITVNTSLINQFAPFEMDITAEEIKYTSSWEDTNTGYKQTETGSWNITTGWLNHYWREEIEQGIVRHEFEIIAGSLTPEFAVGVKVGDSNTLRFTDILMMYDGTPSEEFHITTRVENVEQNLTMKVPDTIDVVVEEINGFNITIYMVFHSSADGDVTADSFTVNIAKLDGTNANGPMFIIPTDPKIIDDMFKDKAEVFYDGDKVYIDSEHQDGDKTYISQNIFDITTGWVIRMSQTTKVDGVEVEKFSAESIGTTISPDDSTTNPSLTPVPLWPSIFFLIIAASFYRRKR